MEKKIKTYECEKYIFSWIHLPKKHYKNSLFHDFFPLILAIVQYGSTHVLEMEKPLSN
jgi:hypothetical protein